MRKRTKVVVFVNRGIVTDVYSSDKNVEVEVLDCDIDPEINKEAYEITEKAAREANYRLGLGDLYSVY